MQQEHGDFHFFPLPLMAFPSALPAAELVAPTGLQILLVNLICTCFLSLLLPDVFLPRQNCWLCVSLMLAELQTGESNIPVNRKDTTFTLQSIFLLLSNSSYYNIYLVLAKLFLRQKTGAGRGVISSWSCLKPQQRSV